jgi:hypothetical protein
LKPIVVKPQGGFANRMIQYMFARALEARVPGAVLSGYRLPEWGLVSQPPQTMPERTLVLTGQQFDLEELALRLRGDEVQAVLLQCYAQRLGYYPDRVAARLLFEAPRTPWSPFGDEYVLVHVRAGDVFHATNADYMPMPLGYFAQAIAETRRKPVFVGETHADTEYCRRLRARFAHARFMPPAAPVDDFRLLQSARHLIIGVGTFGFLASWLSDADTIRMPVRGLMNPRQVRDVNLLPADDRRYRFYRFPILKWRATPDQLDALYRDEALEPMGRDEVSRLSALRA